MGFSIPFTILRQSGPIVELPARNTKPNGGSGSYKKKPTMLPSNSMGNIPFGRDFSLLNTLHHASRQCYIGLSTN